MKTPKLGLLLLMGCFGLTAGILGQSVGGVAYPEGYRAWTHVKSMIVEKGHPLFELVGGLHHIYANSRATQGYQANPRVFPEGAVIVFDLLEPVVGNNAVVEGKRKAVIVMEKDSRRFAATGNWGYAVFEGDGRRAVEINVNSCYECHKGAANTDFVFSSFRP